MLVEGGGEYLCYATHFEVVMRKFMPGCKTFLWWKDQWLRSLLPFQSGLHFQVCPIFGLLLNHGG